jgi:hypothetical protein
VEGEPAGVIPVAGKDVLAVTMGLRQRAAVEHLLEAMRLQPVAEDERVDDLGAGNLALQSRLGEAPLVDDGVGEFGHACGGAWGWSAWGRGD